MFKNKKKNDKKKTNNNNTRTGGVSFVIEEPDHSHNGGGGRGRGRGRGGRGGGRGGGGRGSTAHPSSTNDHKIVNRNNPNAPPVSARTLQKKTVFF